MKTAINGPNNQPFAALTIASADAFTPAWSLYQMYGYAMQAIWTSGINGIVKIQASIDGVTWSDITGTPQAIAGSAGDFIWNVPTAMYQFARLYYANSSSSTGTITVNAESKGP
jgi:hypothetical protein